MARKLASFGHQVKLISPQFVRPFVKSNKNDFVDAEAICEAASHPVMRFVTPKTESQQTLAEWARVMLTRRHSNVRRRVSASDHSRRCRVGARMHVIGSIPVTPHRWESSEPLTQPGSALCCF
ncbi:hypothetical protein R54767_05270 [Paraburkholderia gardini]|uniref:Transposase n=1 Tax=Paraburkholderia gardini TaxID=2823469 RepID=A0ABN7QTS1_9BURK|nr:hypothetical protein R54767_05270 [Paraburkholderia gardini]